MKRLYRWWRCKVCNKKYEFKTDMINHIAEKHVDLLMEENIDDTVPH